MNYILLGQPNVGKSSIFNILTGKNKNIVHKEEGTTRDWHKGKIFSTTDHYIYDTPGVMLDLDENINIKSINLLDRLLSKIDFLRT